MPLEALLSKLVNIDPADLGPGRATLTGLEHMSCFVIRRGDAHVAVLGARSSAAKRLEEKVPSPLRSSTAKAFATQLRSRVAGHVTPLKEEHGLTPGLAVVLVGDDPASEVYVRNKGRQSLEAGMKSVGHKLPTETCRSGCSDRAAERRS